MESSSVRWTLSCDSCEAGGAIGRDERGADAWCEACQRAQRVEGATPEPRCESCGGKLSLDRPRFVEAWSEAQNLQAVVSAWSGDPAPLAAILPERPRFLSDLTPPSPRPDDPPELADALSAVSEGAWRRALRALETAAARAGGDPRLWRARAIAEERLGDSAAAEASWARLLETGEDSGARLARGALRARRAEFAGAREDFGSAGEGREASWNRAALRVLEAVAVTPGLPAPEVMAKARAEAGTASDYWSEPTVGRLLWTLLVERALWRARHDASACADARLLRAAESELEHDTFWDRALLLHGYAALGMRAEAAAIAAPLARTMIESLAGEPFLRARRAEPIRMAVEAARAAIRAGDPAAARDRLTPLLARADLRGYGVPCEACGRGTMRAAPAGE